ncbi:MAG: DUF1501 domain-containing protein [Chlorobi bacterium]|nr:DUF1501 domain-containing protein [Chlorobiota bacterium]
MIRRSFIKRSSAIALPLIVNGLGFKAVAKSKLSNLLTQISNDRVLVIIQLEGGNDGLNTVVPVEIDMYYKLRPNIGIKKETALPIIGEPQLRFHSAMTGMKQLFDNGELAVIENIGYLNNTMSHFEGTEIWNTASSRELKNKLDTGWIGRFLKTEYPNYPNVTPTDPPAIQISPATSSLFAGRGSSIAMSLTDPTEFYNLVNSGINKQDNIEPDTPAGREFNFVNLVGSQSVQFADSIKRAASKAANLVTYPKDNSLAEELAIIARLVAGGLQTRVYMVTLKGFDTHASQLQRHDKLLKILSDSIKAFSDDLKKLGVKDKVTGMTYSEFGRRVNDNGSGTDHGMASNHFVFGSQVKGGKIFGGLPDFNNLIGGNGDFNLQFKIDYRCYYASVLKGVFGISDKNIPAIFPIFDCKDILSIVNAPTTGLLNTSSIKKLKLS